jgi:hypothetical protein
MRHPGKQLPAMQGNDRGAMAGFYPQAFQPKVTFW